MRVLQVHKYNYLRAGAESVFFNTIRLLEEHGHATARFCTHHPLNEPSEYDRYFVDAPEIRDMKSVWRKIGSIPRFIINRDSVPKLERLIADFRPDIAHLHNIFNGLSLSILPVFKRCGVPVVITLHDTRFICPTTQFNLKGKLCDNCLKTWGINCGLHRCFEHNFPNSWMCALELMHKERFFPYDDYIDRYIFVSHKYMEFHAKRHAYFSEKGTVLYNFASHINDVKPAFGHGDYFLFYGRITESKGILTLIDVMRRMPDLKLHVVGTGPLLEQLRREELPNVKFFGYKSGDELFDQVKNASFVVVPSEWEENNPMTIIESYIYGTPVIGSSMGGIPEIIEEGKTGFVFKAFDKDALASAIRRASQVPPEHYTEMSRNARRFAETHFDPEVHYNALMQIYEEAINRHKQTRP